MLKLLKELNKSSFDKLIKTDQPNIIEPMLATLTENYFSSDDWIYEHKFDGERCIVFKKDGKVILKSRNNKIINNIYPEIVKAFEEDKADDFIMDGEIIARNSKGISDFELLQGRINLQNSSKIQKKEKELAVFLNIFDLIYYSGYDFRNLPLYARKNILKNILHYNKILIYTDHIKGDGINYFHKACKLKWEGVIAKKFDSIYVGSRSPNWLKFKCIMQQELVIGGYTNPKGNREGFGALLVGYYNKDKLVYAGKVGTGFTEDTLNLLFNKMKKIVIKDNPFTNYDESTMGVNWIKPILVAEFKFANWTKAGKLRVGRYKGLRDDKDAKNVVKEEPKKN